MMVTRDATLFENPPGPEFFEMNEMKIFAGKTMQRRVFWSFVCLIAVAYFIVRGPLRGYESAEDFAGILDSSRCWTLGLNPYLPTDLAACSLDHAPAIVTGPQVHPPRQAC